MHLAPQEVERFYRIWFPLLYFVNQKQNLVSSFPAQWGKASVQPEAALPLRDALWADDSLREAFIAENPAKLSSDDLALVESWKYRVGGTFFIFRHLKKYTVFLSNDSPFKVYGVLGLVSPLEDIVGPYLPILVQAVLLPFEDRIIYDSLLQPYSVLFGGGIRRDLNDQYRLTIERSGTITTLLPDRGDTPATVRKSIAARNKKVLTAFQKDLGQAGLTPKMMEEHTRNIADFAQEFLLSQKTPKGLLDIKVADVQAYLKKKGGKTPLVSFKRFVQFLRDTGRLDIDEVYDILDFLKQERQR